jgi:hypothetical protein
MVDRLRKVYFMVRKRLHLLGGAGILPVRRTGWKPVPPKAAGTEARPTNLFMV